MKNSKLQIFKKEIFGQFEGINLHVPKIQNFEKSKFLEN